MDDAYDKWFNEERDKNAEWGDVLRSAYDAGLKRGLAADRFDPYEDDYDPKRSELLGLAGKLIEAPWKSAWETGTVRAQLTGTTEEKRMAVFKLVARDSVLMAKAIVDEVDGLTPKEPTP